MLTQTRFVTGCSLTIYLRAMVKTHCHLTPTNSAEPALPITEVPIAFRHASRQPSAGTMPEFLTSHRTWLIPASGTRRGVGGGGSEWYGQEGGMRTRRPHERQGCRQRYRESDEMALIISLSSLEHYARNKYTYRRTRSLLCITLPTGPIRRQPF